MKNLTISTAIGLGFDFSKYSDEDFSDIERDILDFLSENSYMLENEYDECEVSSSGRSQNVSYGGYFTSSGDILSWYDYRFLPKQKVHHSEFLMIKDNGLPISMNLWCWSKKDE